MQIILREDVASLGRSGEVVNVKPGFGRNYLIPQGLAVAASDRNLARLEHDKKQILARTEKRRKESQKLADKLGATPVTIARAVGDSEKLFGSVGTADIEAALREQGIEISRKKISLPDGEPLRALGVYHVDVQLERDLIAKVKVWVVAK